MNYRCVKKGYETMSHYMECTVKSPFNDVFHALGEYFGNVYAKEFGGKNENHVGVVLGEQYFFRVNSDVAIMIILEERSPRETRLQIISCAGGSGFLGLSYNAHSAYVHNVRDILLDYGFRGENERELQYFSRSY